MARNAEKAMTTLARWRAAQVQEAGGQRERRPYLASDCNDLPQAEKWRLQIVREIAKKVAQIQNAYKYKMDDQTEAALEGLGLPNENNVSAHVKTRENIRDDIDVVDAVFPERKLLHNESPLRIQSPLRIESPPRIENSPRIVSPRRIESPPRFENSPPIESPPHIENSPRIESPRYIESPPGIENSPRIESPRHIESPPHLKNSPRIKSLRHIENPPGIENSPRIVSPRRIENSSRIESPLSIESTLGIGSQPPTENSPRTNSPKRNESPKIASTNSPQTLNSNIGRDTSVQQFSNSPTLPSVRSSKNSNNNRELVTSIANLEPKGKLIENRVEKLNDSVKNLVQNVVTSQTNCLPANIEKIATMSKALTNEANALRDSIKSLSKDITRAKQRTYGSGLQEDINFPYHLFLIEIIINKIHMKCECFDIDYNNLVISATFLGKQPIILYDSSYGEIQNFNKLNVGKSTLFAITYDKICSIKEFIIVLSLTKQPPCSTCVTKIGETRMDYTNEFVSLRDELCTKWREQQPNDNILYTTSTPLSKNMYYLSCGSGENSDSIGILEVSVRLSFLGKEINTAFRAQPKPEGTSFLLKDDHGMTMYSSQKVEMDDQGKILLDECVMSKKNSPCAVNSPRKIESPYSHATSLISKHSYQQPHSHAGLGEFRIRDLNDEINKLMREKRHWEVQIKSLGGPDHARVGPKMLDQDGKEVPGNRGYKYFGAAKDLPGVRELFEQEPPPPPRRTRADLMRDVDADYYGYRDDDDGLLMPLEQEAEKEAIARAVDEWKRNKEQNKEQDISDEENIYPEDPDDKRIEDEDDEPATARRSVTSHVAVPSQQDIQEALLRKKKQELLEKYGCMDVDIKLEES